jgi:hypothetical protein
MARFYRSFWQKQQVFSTALRRLAHKAADSGLLSPELGAGIPRVKGVKQLGHRALPCVFEPVGYWV